jgi:cytochrome c553
MRLVFYASWLLAILALFLAAPAPARATEASTILQECAACHGVDGVGRDIEIPNLAGQQERYLYLQLQNFKSGKRPHKEMRYESRHLSDEEMKELSHYYAQLPAGR